MINIAIAPFIAGRKKEKQSQRRKINRYYDHSTELYKYWSRSYNMHFGYGAQFWNREKMLNGMNAYVNKLINVADKTESKVLDIGCGTAATLRFLAKKTKHTQLHGCTLVNSQVNFAKDLINKTTTGERIHIFQDDYHHLSNTNEKYDAIYALESLCHSEDPEQVLRTAFSKLKEGGRLVVVDGVLRRPIETCSPTFKPLYKALCKGWALPGFATTKQLEKSFRSVGFENIKVKDITTKIVASALHNPWVILKLLFALAIGREHWSEDMKQHLTAAAISTPLGMHLKDFAYYSFVAEKPNTQKI